MLSSIILCAKLEFIDFEYQHQEDFKQIKGSQALMMYLMDALAKIKKYTCIYTVMICDILISSVTFLLIKFCSNERVK